MKSKKTNAMRILDGLNISYEVREYEDNTDHEVAKGAALRTAEKLGLCVAKKKNFLYFVKVQITKLIWKKLEMPLVVKK